MSVDFEWRVGPFSVGVCVSSSSDGCLGANGEGCSTDSRQYLIYEFLHRA